MINFPNNSHFQTAVIKELIYTVFDLFCRHDGLHHNAGVRVLMCVVVAVLNAGQELHHLQLVSRISQSRPTLGFPHQEGSPLDESQVISGNLVDISQVEGESQ